MQQMVAKKMRTTMNNLLPMCKIMQMTSKIKASQGECSNKKLIKQIPKMRATSSKINELTKQVFEKVMKNTWSILQNGTPKEATTY